MRSHLQNNLLDRYEVGLTLVKGGSWSFMQIRWRAAAAGGRRRRARRRTASPVVEFVGENRKRVPELGLRRGLALRKAKEVANLIRGSRRQFG
jgi:hypothetical protein